VKRAVRDMGWPVELAPEMRVVFPAVSAVSPAWPYLTRGGAARDPAWQPNRDMCYKFQR